MSDDGRETVPRLMLIADGFVTGRPELDAASIRQRILALVAAGVPWVSLRDHDASPEDFLSTAAPLAQRLRREDLGVLLSVHGRVDAAYRLASGLHLGWRNAEEDVDLARLGGPLGVSVHSATAARHAQRAGADYVTFSPVFETRTHPDAVPTGIDPLRLAVETVEIPILALGGMTPPRARIAGLVGAHGAAAIASLLFAWDETETVRQFLDAVRQ
ncbi:MAG: thiamine phosphate synthase [Bacteroidota bacterium]